MALSWQIGQKTFVLDMSLFRDDDRERRAWHKKPASVFALYAFIFILVYWERWIPSPGEAVAAMAVAASVMTVLGEMGGREKVAWIVLLFGFLSMELTSISKERTASESLRRQANAEEAANFRKIGRGIEDQNTASAKELSNMLAQTNELSQLDREVAGLYRQIDAAKEKHDPQLVHDLEAKAQAAQQDAARVSEELRALTMASLVADQLRSWEQERDAHRHDLENREWEDQIHVQVRPGESRDAANNRVMAEWQKEYDKNDAEYLEKLKQFIVTADWVRRTLLSHLPAGQAGLQIDKDEQEDFAQGLKDPMALNQQKAANYIAVLVQRVPPVK